MKDSRRNRRLAWCARVPQQRARCRIVHVNPLGGIDEELVPSRSAHDQRRAMRDTVVAAIGLPLLLAGARVERQQVRVRHVVAQQDQEIAVQRGRAAVSPSGLERRVLVAEVPRPDDAALHVERQNLAVAEPGVDALAIGQRRRGGQVVLLVELGQQSSGFGSILPQPLAVGPPERLDDEPHLAPGAAVGSVRFRARSAYRPLVLGERTVIAGKPRMCLAASQRGAADLRRDEDTVGPHDGRRGAESRERSAPGDVLVCAPRRRQIRLGRHAEARRPAPLRPVLGRELGRLDEPHGKRQARACDGRKAPACHRQFFVTLSPETVPSVLCAKRIP